MSHWIHPNTICLQLLSLYRWCIDGWWKKKLFCVYTSSFPMLLAGFSGTSAVVSACRCQYWTAGLTRNLRSVWESTGVQFLLLALFFPLLWNLLIMCSFVKPASYSSPYYISYSKNYYTQYWSQSTGCCQLWWGEKPRLDLSIIKK